MPEKEGQALPAQSSGKNYATGFMPPAALAVLYQYRPRPSKGIANIAIYALQGTMPKQRGQALDSTAHPGNRLLIPKTNAQPHHSWKTQSALRLPKAKNLHSADAPFPRFSASVSEVMISSNLEVINAPCGY